MAFEIGEVIAERWFDVINQDGTNSKARVRMGRPQRLPDCDDFYAPYEIECNGRTRLWYSAGVDGFQAVRLAMKMVDAEIQAFANKYKIKITWEGDPSGRLGFVD